ncbi:MAG TPA: hypothetical protein VIM16_17500 [Mucilaginibacter sp.]|jgi:hypothetical protein
MSYIIKPGDYGTHLKINHNLKTEVEAVKDEKLKFCDFDEWVNLSEVKLFSEAEPGFQN